MDTYRIIERLEVKTGISSPLHTAIKPYLRKEVAEYALQLLDTSTLAPNLSERDRQNLHYLVNDNNEWLSTSEFPTTLAGKQQPVYEPVVVEGDTLYKRTEYQTLASQENDLYLRTKRPFLWYFYKTPANLFEAGNKFFHLKVNPLFRTNVGRSFQEERFIYNFQRGVEMRGGIDDRVFFYTNLVVSQAHYPDYVNGFIEKYKAVPNVGFYKGPQELWLVDNSYDFINSQGYIGFNVTSHVGVQFGHGTNFIGNGYRSLFLSDFSNNYLHLKLNGHFWKIHYQSIFAELAANGTKNKSGNELVSKKYVAAHYLNVKNLLPNFDMAVFEATVFGRENHFEFQYLNPVILYRSVEGDLGSPDNVMLGIDAKWNLLKRVQLYGQVLFDEFKFDELIEKRNGWWANKYSLQAGLKYVDFLTIDQLDVQVEYNFIRPYTYMHFDSTGNYTHFNQPLAHPLGANAKEWIVKVDYQPFKNVFTTARLLHITTGEDHIDSNWGSNLLYSYLTREQEYGNKTGQGIATDILVVGLDVSFQFWHNMYMDVHYFYRKKDSAENALDTTTNYIAAGLRMNLGRQRLDF